MTFPSISPLRDLGMQQIDVGEIWIFNFHKIERDIVILEITAPWDLNCKICLYKYEKHSLAELYKPVQHKSPAVGNTLEKNITSEIDFIQSICCVVIQNTTGIWGFTYKLLAHCISCMFEYARDVTPYLCTWEGSMLEISCGCLHLSPFSVIFQNLFIFVSCGRAICLNACVCTT